MKQDDYDIGKILGCMVFALGSRELIRFIHRLIVGSTMLHIPFFAILLISIGIGLYFHKMVAWGLLLSMMILCEGFVLIIAIAIPVKMCLGLEVRAPDYGQSVGITTLKQLYMLLIIYGSLFAGVLLLLLTRRARREFQIMENEK